MTYDPNNKQQPNQRPGQNEAGLHNNNPQKKQQQPSMGGSKGGQGSNIHNPGKPQGGRNDNLGGDNR